MGLLAEIYGVFGLAYSIALIKLKHANFSRTDIAFIAASATFSALSLLTFLNQLRVIPWGNKCTFVGKSILRGVLGPLHPLLVYRILFCSSKGRVKKALTFSNEAYDGVERTRQLVIYELDKMGSEVVTESRYLQTHPLLWYEKESAWGYKRLVGEIWVTLKFTATDFPHVDQSRTLETSEFKDRLVLQYGRDPTSTQDPMPIMNVDTSKPVAVRKNPEKGSREVSCLDCVCVRPEKKKVEAPNPPQISGGPSTSGTAPTPQISGVTSTSGTAPTPPAHYEVTITRRWEKCRIRDRECCGRSIPGCSWGLLSREVRKWTLLQIHQYMICLDVWGNHPKQGIWKPEQDSKPWCSGSSCCCNSSRSGHQQRPTKFRYCYRHDELIDAIHENKRITRRSNQGISYTVV